MSQISATAITEGAPPRSTRQLLDELDALMDKMLALPVEDDPMPSPMAAPEFVVASPTVAATLTLIEPTELPAPIAEQPVVEIVEVQLSKKQRGRGAAERKRKPQPPTRQTIPDDATPVPIWCPGRIDIKPLADQKAAEPVEKVAVASTTSPVTALTKITAEPPPVERESRPLPKSSASWLYGTTVIWERGFRRFTRRLGPLGWLMRTGVGRTLLGLAGLGLWLVALAWLLRDWM